jgi:hypothetical protein
MADNPEPIQVSITAEIKGLMDGLGQATNGVKAATQEMVNSFSGLASTVASLQAPLMALTAVLAGGAMFKEAISSTTEWTGEVVGLSKRLGMTTESASGLALALHKIGMSSDEYGGTVARMTRQMRTNEDAYKRLGIATKDSNGQWRNSQDVLMDVIAKLNGMEAGTNRNVAAQALLGGRVGDISKLLKINNELIAEEQKLAEDLNMVVGPDGAAKAKEYKAAMADISISLKAFAIGVGSALIPALTDLAKSVMPVVVSIFKLAAPVISAAGEIIGVVVNVVTDLTQTIWKAIKEAFTPLVEAFKTVGVDGDALLIVLRAVEYDFTLLGFAVKAVAEIAAGAFKTLLQGIDTLGYALQKLMRGDFAAASAIAKNYGNQIIDNFHAVMDHMVDDAATTQKKLDSIWKSPGKATSKAIGGDTLDGDDLGKGKKEKADKDPSAEQLQKMRDELEAQKALKQNWFTWSDAQEKAFWQKQLTVAGLGAKALAEVQKEVNKLTVKEAKDGEKDAEKDADRKIQMARDGSAERVTLAQQEADRIKGVYGAQSEQYRAAMDKVEAATKAHQQKMIELDKLIEQNHRDAALEQLDTDLQIAQEQQSAGLISKQKLLAAEVKYENDKYQIMLQAAKAEAALEPDPVKHQELLNKIEQIDRQHQTRITALDRQAIADRRQSFNTWISGMTSGMETAFAGLVKGTMSWGKAFQTVMSSAVDFAIKQLWKMLAQHITVEASKTSATVAGTTARTGVEQVAATKSLAMKVIDGIRHLFTETGKTTATTTGAATRAGVDAAATAKSATADAGELAAHTATETAKTAATTTAVTARVLAAELGNVLEIMSLSAVAAAAAFASTAAIPIVGPAAAPAAATAAEAAVMAFAPMASFDFGGIMAKDGFAFVHQSEGVLTAPATQMLKTVSAIVNNGGLVRAGQLYSGMNKTASLASGNGGGAAGPIGGGGDTHVHAHFNGCFDAKSFFQKNQGAIVATLSDAVKNRRTS